MTFNYIITNIINKDNFQQNIGNIQAFYIHREVSLEFLFKSLQNKIHNAFAFYIIFLAQQNIDERERQRKVHMFLWKARLICKY